MSEKICPRCKEKKPITSFGRKTASADGHNWTCKGCENEYQKAYYRKNISVTRSRKSEWMRKHRSDPVNREKIRIRQREFYATSGGKRHREYERRFAEEHFFRHRAKRFCGKRSDGTVTARALAALWKEQRGHCALTGRKLNRAAQLDHILPQSRGGKDTIKNLRWVCHEVNILKRHLTDAELIALCTDVLRWIGERIEKVEQIEAREVAA